MSWLCVAFPSVSESLFHNDDYAMSVGIIATVLPLPRKHRPTVCHDLHGKRDELVTGYPNLSTLSLQ